MSEPVFDHATGLGYISGVDWVWGGPPAPVKPAYRDALTAGRRVDVIVHERHCGFDAGALRTLDRLERLAKTDHRDSTDYSASNTASFRAHWTRRISGAILLAVGLHLREQSELLARRGMPRRRGPATRAA